MNSQIPYRYISIEGSIGAGKTALTKKLQESFQANIILERFAENAFLPLFYQEPEKYALQVELTFLEDRYRQLKEITQQPAFLQELFFADYFIDKCLIFAKNNLKQVDYELYRKIFDIMASLLPQPDLIIYLKKESDALLQNIAKRGRSYEQNIKRDYLDEIGENYMQYLVNIQNIPILVVESSTLDFVNNPDDLTRFQELIQKEYKNGIQLVER